MIDLKKYFDDNVDQNEYYCCKFGNYRYLCEVGEYILYDDLDVIKEFKKLIYPYNNGSSIDEEKFIYLCFYLYNSGYIIEDFPYYLERATDRWTLSYEMIRNSIIAIQGYSESVAWADRRLFIDNMKFIKNNINNNVTEDINNMMKNISTRNVIFQEMTIDEKLKEICNCIEFMLKKDGSFVTVEYSDSCDYLSDAIVKNFRNKLECFRHAAAESLAERKSYTDNQKKFLVEYGILILNYLKSKINK